MDTTLGYLRESLSNHLEHGIGQNIYRKIVSGRYANEEEFVEHLEEREMEFLNQVLEHEMKYALNEQDHNFKTTVHTLRLILLFVYGPVHSAHISSHVQALDSEIPFPAPPSARQTLPRGRVCRALGGAGNGISESSA